MGGGAEVVDPRVGVERQVRILLQVLDQWSATADVRLLQFERCPITHDRVVVLERVLDGVVQSFALVDGVRGVPHPTTGGIGRGATEPVTRLDQGDVQSLSSRGVGPTQAATSRADYQHIHDLVEMLVGVRQRQSPLNFRVIRSRRAHRARSL